MKKFSSGPLKLNLLLKQYHMKLIAFLTTLIILITLTGLSFGEGEMVLRKETMAWAVTIDDDVCYQLITIKVGDDVPDMRNQPCFFRDGKYTLTLTGPPGTTVTLFGKFNFKKDNGFLTIKKKDNRKIWLLDLIYFPADQWFYSEANKDSGAFETFYKPSPIFEESLYSIKWDPNDQ
tara:strand:- start:143 stop:673 length:531 start_codon:yes stop_codon:yes gene_type:complete